MARPKSTKAPNFSATHVQMRAAAELPPHARAARIRESLQVAQTRVDEALRADLERDRLELITAAIRFLVDAQATTVAHLREKGASWTDVGEPMGITRQAAQNRFGKDS